MNLGAILILEACCKFGGFEASGNLLSLQAVKLPVASRGSQYTKKGSFYSESRPEVNDQSFYKRL
jgi:hypothetical protein